MERDKLSEGQKAVFDSITGPPRNVKANKDGAREAPGPRRRPARRNCWSALHTPHMPPPRRAAGVLPGPFNSYAYASPKIAEGAEKMGGCFPLPGPTRVLPRHGPNSARPAWPPSLLGASASSRRWRPRCKRLPS